MGSGFSVSEFSPKERFSKNVVKRGMTDLQVRLLWSKSSIKKGVAE